MKKTFFSVIFAKEWWALVTPRLCIISILSLIWAADTEAGARKYSWSNIIWFKCILNFYSHFVMILWNAVLIVRAVLLLNSMKNRPYHLNFYCVLPNHEMVFPLMKIWQKLVGWYLDYRQGQDEGKQFANRGKTWVFCSHFYQIYLIFTESIYKYTPCNPLYNKSPIC